MGRMGENTEIAAFFLLLSAWWESEAAEMFLASVLARARRRSPLGALWRPGVNRCSGAAGGLCGGGRDGSLFTCL